jgi:glycine cleavage system H protein
MSEIPTELKYTKSHEWVRVEGDVAFIGITEHAQSALGDMVFVELPEDGTTFSLGDEFGVVESVKAASDLYAPVSGDILSTNSQLEDEPGQINASPYTDGWLVQMTIKDKNELTTLLDSDAYIELLEQE